MLLPFPVGELKLILLFSSSKLIMKISMCAKKTEDLE